MTSTWSNWTYSTASKGAVSVWLLLALGVPLAAQSAPQALPAPAAVPAAEATEPSAPPTPTAGLIASMDHLDDKREINVGDTISFRVVEDRDPPVSRLVTDSGEVEIPYIGRVKAQGETCQSLAVKLKDMLERDYYYQATVLIGLDSYGSKSRGKVYLTGQVMNPGAQELPLGENLTVSKAILAAGGMGDFADRRKVHLVRKRHAEDKKPEVIIVDVKAILEEGKAVHDPELRAGDLIIVKQRMINF